LSAGQILIRFYTIIIQGGPKTGLFLNMAKFKISVLLLIKSWTFWYIERLPASSYTGVTYFKNGQFFWPTMYILVVSIRQIKVGVSDLELWPLER